MSRPPAWTAAALLVAAAACGTGLRVGPPLAEPGTAAREAESRSGPREPAFLQFEWDYADDRGSVRGEGAGRYNPRDSLRVDLFSAGDVNLAVALVDGRLASSGRIEGVELPGAPFMYAMAGIFYPTKSSPASAHSTNRGLLLRYEVDGAVREYLVRDGRLQRVEERSGAGVRRRVTVEWDSAAVWPSSAEYRNFDVPRRVRWRLSEARTVSTPFDVRIYDLPESPQP